MLPGNIRSDLVSSTLFQHDNDGNTDDYGASHMCYLWIIRTSFLLHYVTFLSSTMEKWRNGEMVPGDGAMMVRLFWYQLFCNWLLSK